MSDGRRLEMMVSPRTVADSSEIELLKQQVAQQGQQMAQQGQQMAQLTAMMQQLLSMQSQPVSQPVRPPRVLESESSTAGQWVGQLPRQQAYDGNDLFYSVII